MKYVDEFRNPAAARALKDRITELSDDLGFRARIMEVCGTHTMAIARNGIRAVLPDNIGLISGPGCPVCVTAPGYIDGAIELAQRGATIVTFGDMLKTPGSKSSLDQCRAAGGAVEVVYSPLAAVDLARKDPKREVVFLAIGFETTIAPVVSLIEIAMRGGIANLSFLTAFKVVPPVLEVLCEDSEIGLSAFLCPAHVSAIIGSNAYLPLAQRHSIPCVVAGFEALDILMGIAGILEQIQAGEARVDNQYSRIVRPMGNRRAQQIMERHLEPADVSWRGLGILPGSGLKLRNEFATFDAEKKFGIVVEFGVEPEGCLCGEIVKGKLDPRQCPMFGAACTPETPIGPCMVSHEGSCAAAYKY